MKLTQFRDCLKNIFKQKISFISIIIIAMLGTASYVGIDYTSNTLRLNGTAVYNEANFRDIESVSTLLFASSDLDDIKALKGVEDAEAVRMAKAKVEKGKEKKNIEVVSVTERINLASVIEGQLPQTAGECAVEKQLADAMGLKVGDTISITGADGGNAQFLTVKDFSISGIVKHPDHTNLVTPDLPYALVLWEAFNEETLGGCYMKTEIVIKDPPNSNRFSKRYTKTVAKVLSRVEELGKTDSQKRQDEVYKVFTAELASNEQKLAKARQELDEARQKLEDGRAQLKSGFSQLEDAKATIRDLIRTAYESAFPDDLAITRVEWAERQTTDPDNPNATARYLWITADYRINLSRIPGDIVNDIVNAKSIPEQFLCEIYKLAVSEELPVADGQTDMSAVRTGLADALTSAGSSFMKLFGAVEEWDSGHEAYLEGKAEYESGLEKYEQGQKQLESAKKQLDEQDKCRWISYDVRGNASFVQLTNGSGNFSSLKITFSMLFVLVGALVIFATVGKIVDEQRTLVGTTKALGLFPREIFLKYLGFSVSATVIGTVLGVLAGAFGVQPFLLRSFGQYYIYDLSRPLFFILPALIALLAGLTLSVFATWIACRHLLKDPAVALMQPKAPGVKKGTGGKRTFLPLYSRLILMNMRTDIKRVIVTIVSIMGCCMLILIGFTLRTAITSTTVRQFDEITNYDLCVRYETGTFETTQEDMQAVLDSYGTEYINVVDTLVTYQLPDLQSAELIAGDILLLEDFRSLNDIKTGKPLYPTNEGILVHRRFFETYGLGTGDEFALTMNGSKTVTVRIGGVFENYIGRQMVMSRAYYESLFGDFEANAFYVRLCGASEAGLVRALSGVRGFISATSSDEDRSIVETSTSAINVTVVLFIFIAGVMAGVVLLNLTNMYILQKKRELTIMRINGFSVRQVRGYVLREAVFTTVVGIILGIGAGALVARQIVRALEQIFIQFDKAPDFMAWLYAAGITVFFAMTVDMIALRKIKHLKLTDIA